MIDHQYYWRDHLDLLHACCKSEIIVADCWPIRLLLTIQLSLISKQYRESSLSLLKYNISDTSNTLRVCLHYTKKYIYKLH